MRKHLLFILAAVGLAACSKAPDQTPGAQETPAVPENLKIHSATETSLTFQWGVVEGAQSYNWKLSGAQEFSKTGTSSSRNCTVDGLTPGTAYSFSVQAVNSVGTSEWSAPLEVSTTGSAPVPPDPSATVLCVDSPVRIKLLHPAEFGTSGQIKVFKEDGTLVDKIDMADMATVEMLDDGTMIPKGADADNGKIAINNDYKFNTFMDALFSGGQYRLVHYTPVRMTTDDERNDILEIKLHNDVLEFGQNYYVTVDEGVVGQAVAEGEWVFSTKTAPSTVNVRVSPDGSNDFCTIQGALTFISKQTKDTPVSVDVDEGEYNELLFLRNRNNVVIQGSGGRDITRIVYPNCDSYETGSGGSVSSIPSLGASIGKSGGRSVFLVEGCDNLLLDGLTLENSYYIPSHKGQAETIYFNGDGKKLTVERCSLISWQDTFLCKGEVWVHRSLIAGHCDYIWGYPKVCLFEDCEIRSRAAGYIVQARVQSASNKGFVFLNCALTAEEGVPSGSMYLARSAGQADCFDNVTYINCSMPAAIAPAGS